MHQKIDRALTDKELHESSTLLSNVTITGPQSSLDAIKVQMAIKDSN